MSNNPDFIEQPDEAVESPADDGVREIFPIRNATSRNVVDFRPRKGDVDEPEEVAELGKAGGDSVPEPASSEASTPSTEPPALTTGVQIPAGLASGLPPAKPDANGSQSSS